ncbi:hypothetical protein BDV96DRAFT_607304 [Lophiotrema nucula]|uniref:Uncharacterized protein n=1 Tax=Lophiotrema nucula TaxID=690887 RepID=A0A6A5YJW0_9PLEO|nr:hypothetical protein BDV96DRAFT_607304 [Lophiotrema nucula]
MCFGRKPKPPPQSPPMHQLEALILALLEKNNSGYGELPDHYDSFLELSLKRHPTNAIPSEEFKQDYITPEERRAEMLKVLRNGSTTVESSRTSCYDCYSKLPERFKFEFHEDVADHFRIMKYEVNQLLGGLSSRERKQDIQDLEKLRETIRTLIIIEKLLARIREKDGILVEVEIVDGQKKARARDLPSNPMQVQ